MDWNVMLKVMMSMVFFAPLLIVLAGFLFVGVLVLFEGAVAFASKRTSSMGATAAETLPNIEAGPIVEGLKTAIAQNGEATQEQNTGTRAANR